MQLRARNRVRMSERSHVRTCARDRVRMPARKRLRPCARSRVRGEPCTSVSEDMIVYD